MLENYATRQFHSLDALRSILALSVAIGHLLFWTNTNKYYPSAFVLSVDFFFVLSGFVIANSFYKSTSREKWMIAFPVRRFFRLFPLYYFSMFVSLSFFLLFKKLSISHSGISEALPILLLFQMIGTYPISLGIFDGTAAGIGWAVSVEYWICIIIFTVLYIIKKNTALIFLTFFIFTVISLQIILMYSPDQFAAHYKSAFLLPVGAYRGITGFSIGILFYALRDKFDNFEYAGLMEIVVTSVIIFIFTPYTYNKSSLFIFPVLAGALIFSFSYQRGPISKLLTGNKMVRFGEFSYGIYLMHPPILFLVINFNLSINMPLIIVYSLICIIVSAICYRAIEKPFMIIGTRISNRISA